MCLSMCVMFCLFMVGIRFLLTLVFFVSFQHFVCLLLVFMFLFGRGCSFSTQALLVLAFLFFGQLLCGVLWRTIVVLAGQPMGFGLLFHGIFAYRGRRGASIHLYLGGFAFPFLYFQFSKFKPSLFMFIKEDNICSSVIVLYFVFAALCRYCRYLFILPCAAGDGVLRGLVFVTCIPML